jgi:hypothetical protein
MSDTKLNPCPFCGGEAVRMTNSAGFSIIRCSECFAQSDLYWSLGECEKAWNTRKPIDRIVEQLEEHKGNVFIDGKKMYQEDYFIDIDDAIKIVRGGTDGN